MPTGPRGPGCPGGGEALEFPTLFFESWGGSEASERVERKARPGASHPGLPGQRRPRGSLVFWGRGRGRIARERERIFRVIRLRPFSTAPLAPGTWGYVALSQLTRALPPPRGYPTLSEFPQRNATQRNHVIHVIESARDSRESRIT